MSTSILSRSYKKRFPFRLATTSYIFPDRILPNASKLAPFIDEIELVLFESEGEDNLPGDDELRALTNLSLNEKISYNVHLPIDVFLGHRNEDVRSKGVSIIKKVIDRTSRLEPSLYTLHFDPGEERDIESWRSGLARSAEEVLESGVPSRQISIETLGYPFEWIEDLVRKFDFSICLDIGHVLVSGYNLEVYFQKYLADTTIVHLHGFENSVDHLAIDKLPEPSLTMVLSALRSYRGILSLELFSLDDLRSSLTALEEKWTKGSFS